MAKVILGKVAISWKKIYDSSMTYSAQDVVSYNNQCYICTTDGTTGTFNLNFWELVTNSPINFASNEFDLIYKNENNQLSVLPIGNDDSVLGIDHFTKSPSWQPLQFQLGSRIQRFANECGQDSIESSCFAIDTNDRLRAWGNNSHFHLGIGSNPANEMLPVHVAFPQDFPGVSKFYSSMESYLGVIDNEGKWWTWGKSSTGGFVGSNISSDIYVPVCLSTDSSSSIYNKTIVQSTQKIDSVSNKYNNMLLDSNGEVHYVGFFGHYQTLLTKTNYENFSTDFSLTSVIKQIASTGYQENATYYMLTNGGVVYSFGFGGNGERGDASLTNQTAFSVFSVVLSGVEKIYGAPGQGYAIDTNGKLYAWGKNNVGQLGTSDTVNRNTPTPTSIFDGTNHKAIDVYFNNGDVYRTTIVTAVNSSNINETYYCGNDFGTAGNKQAFTKINALDGKVITKVACVGGNGSTNTITALFLTSANEIYTIGFGSYGQIGNGEGNTTTVIQELIHIGKDINIIDIHGFGHNEYSGFCLLDENGRLFYMGAGTNMKSADDDNFHKFTLQEVVF